MGNQMTTKKYIFAEAVLIFGVFMCLLSMIFKNNIWFDESFTINLVSHPMDEMIRLTALDVHPPLYYIAVKLSTVLFGQNHFALYLPSMLCFIALLAVSGYFFRKYFSPKTGLLVTAVFCAAPNMLKYAVQLRMYSMAMLLVTLAFYLVYVLYIKLTDENYTWDKSWIILAVINTLAAYTHYFAGVAAVAISLFLLLYILLGKAEGKRRKLLHWCLYCGQMLLLYLPWIPVLFRQMSAVNQDYWIEPLTEGALHSYPAILLSMPDEQLRMLLTAVYLVGFFLIILQFHNNPENHWTVGCYIVIAIWFAFGIGYSVLKKPILTDRYMVILLPLFWIPICIGYSKTAYKYLRIVLIFIFTVCFTPNYELLYHEYSTAFQNEMVAYVSERLSEDDVFYHMYVQNLSIGKAYFPDAKHYTYEGGR